MIILFLLVSLHRLRVLMQVIHLPFAKDFYNTEDAGPPSRTKQPTKLQNFALSLQKNRETNVADF